MLFELDAAVHRAQVAQARADHGLAQRNYQRGLELFERKLISQQERDTLPPPRKPPPPRWPWPRPSWPRPASSHPSPASPACAR
ncbi:hypothetical protein [Solimonas sp. K1W22B-7]|uniref:hypothetical protein n=1 Tax=Solimonas sp. K1W22B-7 TaxID=2303331 RepID=UPI001F09A5DA